MKRHSPRNVWKRAIVAAVLAIAGTGSALAQPGYPDHTIRIIVPFSAGGSSDLQARMLADRLGKLYKQSVVVENRPGAGGHIGGKAVVDAAPDGYTLLLGSLGLHATYATFKKLNYNPATDLKVVTVLAEMPHVVVVNPKLAVNNLQQLASLARQQPDTRTFGSAGVGSSVHMMGELFRLNANAPITHVPYKGSSAAMTDLLGGQIDMMFENPPTTLAYIRSGKLKALAVTGTQRSSALPDMPTFAESGMQDSAFKTVGWIGLVAPVGVPAPILARLEGEVRAILQAPDMQERLVALGLRTVGSSPAEAQALYARDWPVLKTLVADSGAKLD